MPSLKEVKNRISSVNSTIQITSAMKMVSAAKLKRAQDAITQMRPYAEKLTEILANLSSSLDAAEGAYSQEREVKSILIIPITSNRGLCGAFNANVIKKTNKLIKEQAEGTSITVMSIGKKSDDFYKKTEYNIRGSRLPRHLNEIYDDLTFENVAPKVEKVMDAYAHKQFDRVVLVYNKFKNAAVQLLTTEQLLPAVPPENDSSTAVNNDYIFEPDKEEIVADLVPKSLKTQLYKALLDSHAAEHGARMTAMHKATDNAEELLRDLRLSYNKARQAAITGEILEIVGGAEALKG